MTTSIATLCIESLTKEGWGKAKWTRPDGRVCNVVIPYCLPGEEITACIRKAKRIFVGAIHTILKKSPNRIEARCIHFGSCGGCSFQHMTYDAQVAFKEASIRALFENSLDRLLPIIPSPDVWHYRNKMEYSFSQDCKKNRYLGLYLSQRKNKVFSLTECHLVNSWIPNTLQAVRAWWEKSELLAFSPHKNEGSLRTITFRDSLTSGDRVIILTVSGRPEYALRKKELDAFVTCCMSAHPNADSNAASTLTIVLRIQQQIQGRPTEFYEMRLFGPESFRERITLKLDGDEKVFEFHISPSSFLQPNALQASTLYSTVLELAKLQRHEVLYDLYAGVGIFGMLASHLVKEVVSIEIHPDAAYDAQTNVDRLKLSNVHTFRGDVAEVLKEKKFALPDVVLVDPPRSGLGPKAIEQIVALTPKRIVYVSCNPYTQAEDVKLLEQSGYKVSCIQPIDQFPHTPHVENIVILNRPFA